jgi:hypothetical protein
MAAKEKDVVISGQLRNGRISRLLNVLWGKIMKKLNTIRKTMAFYWNLKKWLFTAKHFFPIQIKVADD